MHLPPPPTPLPKAVLSSGRKAPQFVQNFAGGVASYFNEVSALRLQLTSPLTELCLCLKKGRDKVATYFETVKLCSVNSVMSDTQNTFVNNVMNFLPDGDGFERSNQIVKRNVAICNHNHITEIIPIISKKPTRCNKVVLLVFF
jgi:hypothetical protein